MTQTTTRSRRQPVGAAPPAPETQTAPDAPEAEPSAPGAVEAPGGGERGAGLRYDVTAAGTVEDVQDAPLAEGTASARLQHLKRVHESRRAARDEAFQRDLEEARKRARRRPRPALKDVPVSHIRRETIYNRELKVARAQRMARKFDWDRFQTVSLNQRADGALWLVDGQHRVAAAVMVFGDQVTIPSTISKVATEGAEAGNFEGINTERSPLSYNVRFNARLLDQQPEAKLVVRLTAAAGLTLTTSHAASQLRPGEINVAATLHRILTRGGPYGLADALGPLRAAFGDDIRGYQSHFLEGTFLLHVLYGADVRPDRLIHVLRVRGPEGLVRLAETFRTGAIERSPVALLLALHAAYNGVGLTKLAHLGPVPTTTSGRGTGVAFRAPLHAYRQVHPPEAPATLKAAEDLLGIYDREWREYAEKQASREASRNGVPAFPEPAEVEPAPAG